MRAAPAVQVTLQRAGVWRVAVSALFLAALAAIVAWALPRLHAGNTALPASLLGALGLLAAGVVSLLRAPPADLRWDGRGWQLRRGSAEPAEGDLALAIDLGVWMLLRFTPVTPVSMRPTPVWLPVQRRGLEGEWHALRCAVHSPRLAAPGGEPGAGP